MTGFDGERVQEAPSGGTQNVRKEASFPRAAARRTC
jgi:hypothetical protein